MAEIWRRKQNTDKLQVQELQRDITDINGYMYMYSKSIVFYTAHFNKNTCKT